MDPLKAVQECGQSIWLDYIRRDLITNGQLQRLVNDGLTGVTSNPTIFQKAISGSDHYDDSIRSALESDPDVSPRALYERLSIEDIQMAADILRPLYERTEGNDGYVSLEPSARLAYDTQATVEEVRRLWALIDRPNAMLKVPSTQPGAAAVEALITEGINVNITLIFSVRQYAPVYTAYIRGLERSDNPGKVASVASFFVSRIDTYTDKELERVGTPQAMQLRGQIAIASAKVAYQRFCHVLRGADFAAQRQRGARVQRVLWGSTSTKNPDYSDVLYVEELIGRDTVNTMPPETLEAFRDHGTVAPTLERGADQAEKMLEQLAELGVDFDDVTERLQSDGVQAFADSEEELLDALEQKKQRILTRSS